MTFDPFLAALYVLGLCLGWTVTRWSHGAPLRPWRPERPQPSRIEAVPEPQTDPQ